MKQIKYHRILKSLKFASIITFFFTCNNVDGQYFFDFENITLDKWSQSQRKPWTISAEGAINGKLSLHHTYDNEEPGLDQISFFLPTIPDLEKNISWSFSVKHAFDPSSSNNWAIFLASNSPYNEMHSKSHSEALVFGVNYIDSDDFPTLWKQHNGEVTVISKMPINWEDDIKDSIVQVAIARSSEGNWLIKLYNNNGVQISSAIALDNYFPPPHYFGVAYQYSAAQDQKFWLDDFILMGSFTKDSIAPGIDTSFFINKNEIIIEFSEPVNFTYVTLQNFVPNKFKIVSFQPLSQNKCKITLDQYIANDSLRIEVNNISDLYENSASILFYDLFLHIPQQLDIVVNEFMADPEPQVQQPPYEYIELLNKSKFIIDLYNWELQTGSNSFKFPSVKINPDSFLIITKEGNEAFFSPFAKTIGLFSSSSTLLNDSGNIILKDSSNKIISICNYDADWFSGYKTEGGWSYEMEDPENTCNSFTNLSISKHQSGGTPGRKNSVFAKNPDLLKPEIVKIRVLSDSLLILHFSEPLICDSIFSILSFTTENGLVYPLKIIQEDADFTSYRLVFDKVFSYDNKYTLKISSDICDCNKNSLIYDTISFFLPHTMKGDEIAFNEILFNSYPGGSKFIELYNRSGNVVDAGKIILMQYDTITREIIYISKISPEGTLFYPNSYLCLTSDIDGLKQYYTIKNEKAIYKLENFPVLNDKQGILSIKNSNFIFLDSVNYSHTQHTSFLPGKEGVSIERLSPEINTLYRSNWQSTAETAGFATPGYQNSRYLLQSNSSETINVTPEVFSPNSDGYNDFVFISLPHFQQAMTVSISIFNASGTLVKNLMQNKYIEPGYVQSWDGSNNNGQLASSGIYIIYIQYLFENGKTNEMKKTCVLSRF